MSEQGTMSAPWVARQDLSGGESADTALWSVIDADDQIVFFGMDMDRARLIAAAPDMLAALKCAHGVIDHDRAPLTIQRIRAAIAKAESQTP